MTNYLIMYTDTEGKPLGEFQTTQEAYEDACLFGWDHAPVGTDDFQVTQAAKSQE